MSSPAALQWTSPNAETRLGVNTLVFTRGESVVVTFNRKNGSSRTIAALDSITVSIAETNGSVASVSVTATHGSDGSTTFVATFSTAQTTSLGAGSWKLQAFDDTNHELLSRADVTVFDNIELGAAPTPPISNGNLSSLAALTLVADSLLYAAGAGDVEQLTLAANTFPARSSSGHVAAKAVTDAALSVLDDTTVSAMVDTLGGASSSGTGGLVRIDSATLTGTPAAPTATTGTSTTQLATTAFVQAAVASLLKLKGDLDCGANPNYPPGTIGDYYYVTVAGKIGGASGVPVDIGDTVVCKATNAGGTQAAVGASWFVIEHNLQGALLSANNLSDVANAATAVNNLGGAASTGTGGLVRQDAPTITGYTFAATIEASGGFVVNPGGVGKTFFSSHSITSMNEGASDYAAMTYTAKTHTFVVGSLGGEITALTLNADGSASISGVTMNSGILIADSVNGNSGVIGTLTATTINGNTITVGTGTLTLTTFTVTAAGNATISGTNTGDQTSFAGMSGSLTGVGDVTGGASSMTVTAGTGNSRTLVFKTTTSGGTATTALTLNADQSANFANTVNATTFVGALSGNASTATTATNATNSAITDDSTNAYYFPTLVSANTGNLPLRVASTKFSVNPSNGWVRTENIEGRDGNAASTLYLNFAWAVSLSSQGHFSAAQSRNQQIGWFGDTGFVCEAQGLIRVTDFSTGTRDLKLRTMFSEATQTSVNGSTSGTAVFSQPEQGGSLKIVIIKMTTLLGTASYTFPTAFATTPSVVASDDAAAGIVTSKSTTACTVTGTTTSGSIMLIGY